MTTIQPIDPFRSVPVTARDVLAALSHIEYEYGGTEQELHHAVSKVLLRARIYFLHEKPIGTYDGKEMRIDFLCDRIGIEIKHAYTRGPATLTQLARYATSNQIDAIILVCERSIWLPDEMNGKPIYCHNVRHGKFV